MKKTIPSKHLNMQLFIRNARVTEHAIGCSCQFEVVDYGMKNTNNCAISFFKTTKCGEIHALIQSKLHAISNNYIKNVIFQS